jgi:hypothetical protein
MTAVEQQTNDAANAINAAKRNGEWRSILPTWVGVSSVLIVVKSSSARCRSNRA